MSSEILVNVNAQETRVAVLESGVLRELIVQRTDRHGLAGNIYLGHVSRVLPGMQAAFVEIGLERTGFLHVADMQSAQRGEEAVATPSIQSLLHEGQKVLVQILKDPLGTKGARLTTQISVPSRYLVLLPDGADAGVSVRIEDDTERERLKSLVRQLMEEEVISSAVGGYIVRTAGEGIELDELRADMRFLNKLWAAVQAQARQAKTGTMVHGDLPLAMRILRDMIGMQVDRVRIDSQQDCRQVVQFAKQFIPGMSERIEYYAEPFPIFDQYGVEDEMQKALQRQVPLKSGGHLVIDQTEALTSVDVNTGGFVGHRNLEETIFKTNLEATHVIARQLRLRNLGGIIIIDFIDMATDEHRAQVLTALTAALASDPAKTSVGEFSRLGLVEMTRKRTRESLEHILCEPCSVCSSRGTLKTVETLCLEIFREVQRSASQFQASGLLVLASPDVIDMMLDEQSTMLAELETQIGRPIKLQSEQLYAQEEYDVVLA